MQIFLFTVVTIATLMLAMSVGVIVTGRSLKGSCGGVEADCACEKQGLPRAKDCPLKKAVAGQSV